MLKKISFISAFKYTFFFTFACLMISLTLILLSRNTDGFAQWYAVNLYPIISSAIGRTFSVWDFSFFEAGILITLVLAVILALIGFILFLIRNASRKVFFSVCLRLLICVMAGLILIYSVTCAVNYQRDGIGTVLKLPTEDISKDKLEKLSIILADDLTKLTNDPDWDYSNLSANDSSYIEEEAVNAMQQLGKGEPSLAGYYPKPKPVYFSEWLSKLGIEGIFSPFTMEANYNNKMTSFLIPYTICHELAHLKGYMKEDDAGFIAFLACIDSPSKVFQYSGIFHALIFTLDALKTEVSTEDFNNIYDKLPQPVRIQLSFIDEQDQVNASEFTTITNKINNIYLEANAQAGTKSYGNIVDLLIADYADRIDSQNLL